MECQECQEYYEKMVQLLKVDATTAPRLTPDPFLPQRIRAGTVPEKASWAGWRPSFATLSVSAVGLAVAIVLGVFAGSTASARLSPRADDATEMSDVYDVGYVVHSFAEGWDALITEEEK